MRDRVDALASAAEGKSPDRLVQTLELAETAWLTYETGPRDEKRELIKTVSSNRRVDGKTLDFTLAEPFRTVAAREEQLSGRPHRDVVRTWDALLVSVAKYLAEHPMDQSLNAA